jgi:hypothetical protein
MKGLIVSLGVTAATLGFGPAAVAGPPVKHTPKPQHHHHHGHPSKFHGHHHGNFHHNHYHHGHHNFKPGWGGYFPPVVKPGHSFYKPLPWGGYSPGHFGYKPGYSYIQPYPYYPTYWSGFGYQPGFSFGFTFGR